MRRLVFAWLPAVGWAGLIFLLSAQPGLRFADEAMLDFVIRKAGHVGVYGILALLVRRALAGTSNMRRQSAWALVLTLLYAVSDELHQSMVVGRAAAIADVAFDATGAFVAIGGAQRFQAWQARSVPG